MHQAMLGAIVPQLSACLSEVEQHSTTDEKDMVNCMGEATRRRKDRWAKFEVDFDRLIGSLREVRAWRRGAKQP